MLLCVFFCQAEDGIRDLVRSRGLGDVYKRQDIDTTRISVPSESALPSTTVSEIEQTAIEQNEAFEKTVSEMEATNTTVLPNEIQKLVKSYSIKDIFKEQAEQINLPQFLSLIHISEPTRPY